MRKLNITQENLVSIPATQIEETSVLVSPDSPEADLLRSDLADNGEAQAVAIINEVEQVAYALESLDNMYAVVKKCQTSGGMSSQTAMAVSVGLEHIYTTLDIPLKPMGVSLESFDTSSSISTAVAMESIREKIVDALVALMKMAQAVFAKVVEFFQDLFSVEKTQQEKLNFIKTALENKDNKYDFKSHRKLTKSHHLGEKLWSPEANPLNMHHEYAGLMMWSSVVPMLIRTNVYGSSISKLLEKGGGHAYAEMGEEVKRTLMLTIQKAGDKNLWPQPSKEAPAGASSTEELRATRLFIGNTGWYYHMPKRFEYLAVLKFGSFHSSKSGAFEELNALTEVQIRNVLGTWEEFNRMLDECRGGIKEMEILSNNLEGYTRTIRSQTFFSGVTTTDTSHIIRAMLKLVSGGGMLVTSKLVSVSNLMLSLCVDSIKARRV